jgi:hypothetical protein
LFDLVLYGERKPRLRRGQGVSRMMEATSVSDSISHDSSIKSSTFSNSSEKQQSVAAARSHRSTRSELAGNVELLEFLGSEASCLELVSLPGVRLAPSSPPRARGQLARLARVLIEAGVRDAEVAAVDLPHISLSYCSRLWTLRKQFGWEIANRIEEVDGQRRGFYKLIRFYRPTETQSKLPWLSSRMGVS